MGPLRLGLLVALGAAAAFAACGSHDAGGPGGFRKSGAGESCTRTDDCEAPLACIALVCKSGGGSGGGAATSSSATASASASSAGGATASTSSSSTGTPLDPKQCHACLAQQCQAERAACDADCLAIEACLEATCRSLSAQGSPEEGQCQVHCQSLYPAAKQRHLDVVNCAQGSNCAACSSNPFDYDACRGTADAGPCAGSKSACTSNSDCKSYDDCITGCTTLATCLACQDSASGMKGYPLDVAYEQCIAGECILESWLK